ncbi:MAG: pyridoxine 5'-phosphate synthase [Bacteroidota bacterium]
MESKSVRLSVNINKIATLRNARGGTVPDVIRAAADLERFGAHGITVHPRPDERHIRRSDIFSLKGALTTEFNIEGYPSLDFLKLIRDIRPAQATLVPDPPDVLTSNAGWDTVRNASLLKDIIDTIKGYGVRTSVFIAPDTNMIEHAAKTGADRIELYTEGYASGYATNRASAIKPYVEAARCALDCGLGINAGHDLNLENLEYFARNVEGLLEVSIGHALISDALYFGLQNTVQLYLRELHNATRS